MKINFEFDTEHGKFSDSLTFAEDQKLPPEVALDAMKQQRLQNWILAITTPPSEDE